MLMSLEMIDRNAVRQEIARNMPLEAMVLSQNDPCVDSIALTFAEPGKRGVEHIVVDPFQLIVRLTDGEAKMLELDAENGTTLVRFHTGKLNELVGEAGFPKPREVVAGGRYI